MDVGGLIQALVAGFLGGAFVPLLSHGREKRKARSIVRKCLFEVEQARWASIERPDSEERFYRALSAFYSEAITAGIPRVAVDLYASLATVCYETSEQNAGKYLTPEGEQIPIGAVNGDTHALVEAARGIVVDAIWRPTLSILTRRLRVARVTKVANLLAEKDNNSTKRDTNWEPWLDPRAREHEKLRNILKRRLTEN